jgi:3-oxoisoapionate decarboxylase
MKLGINSYTFMWSIGFRGLNPAYPDKEARPAQPLSALGLLEKARQYGLSLVQTGPNLGFDLLSPAEQDEFIDRAREWNITLELGTRGLDYDHLVGQVALAKRMGARLIRTLPELDGQYLADARRIPAALRAILPVLAGEGIRLALENGRTPAAELRAALDEVASPSTGVVLDMVNSLAVPEGWKEVTRLLAPHTMCLHYKDFTIQRAWHMMGFLCEGAPAGQGLVETGWLFEQLKASPYDFNVIIELWPPEQPTLEQTIALEQAWADQSVTYLRQYIPD